MKPGQIKAGDAWLKSLNDEQAAQYRTHGGASERRPEPDELLQRAASGAQCARQARPDVYIVNEGANTLDFGAQHHRHAPAAPSARQRHLGRHGHRHGLCRRRRRGHRQAGRRDRGRQRLWLQRHGDRDDLPLRAAGRHDRLQQQRHLPRRSRGQPTPSPTGFVQNARYEKIDRGVRRHRLSRDRRRPT